MKNLAVVVLCLGVLAGAGYAAYRFGLLGGVLGTAAPGGPASTAASGAVSGGAAPAAAPAPPDQPPQAAAPGEATEATPSAVGEAAANPPDAAAPGDATPASAAPAPIPEGLVAVGREGAPVANKALEVRVTSVRTEAAIANRQAPDGREYVVVDSEWKSLVAPQKVNRKKAQDRTAGMGGLGFGGGTTARDRAEDEANTTLEDVPFEIGPLTEKVRLVVDGRSSEVIDTAATNATDGHLPPGTLRIPAQNAVKSGPLVFQAPAGARDLSLLVLDSANGHLLVPIRGETPRLATNLGIAGSRSNDLVDLAVTDASWRDAGASARGARLLVLTVKGISRQNAIADIPFGDFGFLQTDAGCVAQPERSAPGLVRSFAPKGSFIPFVPTDGQLAFVVPAETKGATLLLRLNQGGAVDLPAFGDAAPVKPASAVTHQDGDVLRIHVVGAAAPPTGLTPPRAGFEQVVVDMMVENLTPGAGVELQPGPQFTVEDEGGGTHQPDPASWQLPCRLSGRNVVPARGWRRFSLVYAVPEGTPLTLKYRGFGSEGRLKIR